MGRIARAIRGAEAGANTAGAIETSFFVLDLVRLRPLATPATRAGGVGRFAVLVALCTGAFFGTVAWSSSVLTLGSVLRVLPMPEVSREPSAETASTT